MFIFAHQHGFLKHAAVGGSGLSCECLENAKILTMIAGGVLILLATFWPCVWFWHQSAQQRSFTPFICYAWLLSLLYFGILCALAIKVYEHHDLMWDPHHGNSSCTQKQLIDCNDPFSSIPLWTFVPMGGMMAFFFIVSCVVCGCLNGAGSIW